MVCRYEILSFLFIQLQNCLRHSFYNCNDGSHFPLYYVAPSGIKFSRETLEHPFGPIFSVSPGKYIILNARERRLEKRTENESNQDYKRKKPLYIALLFSQLKDELSIQQWNDSSDAMAHVGFVKWLAKHNKLYIEVIGWRLREIMKAIPSNLKKSS